MALTAREFLLELAEERARLAREIAAARLPLDASPEARRARRRRALPRRRRLPQRRVLLFLQLCCPRLGCLQLLAQALHLRVEEGGRGAGVQGSRG